MNISRRHLLAGIVIFALLLLLGHYVLQRRQAPPPLPDIRQANLQGFEISDAETNQEIQVYVGGAVASAGVYRLLEGDRVHQALSLAGPLPNADLRYLGMARELIDGESILVPEMQAGEAVQGEAGPALPAGKNKININRATTAELDAGLEGIGPGLAQQIVDYRNTNGPFKKIEDIRKVGGIGEKRFEAIKDSISVY
ncbi:MAG TPA: competence protein ComEA [Syntrophomonas sp.]|nr:competence protein ComEA [Syntrophomonas sp.]